MDCLGVGVLALVVLLMVVDCLALIVDRWYGLDVVHTCDNLINMWK